jgi:hypothetical protein
LTQTPITWSKPAIVNQLLCTSSPRYNIFGWASFGKDRVSTGILPRGRPATSIIIPCIPGTRDSRLSLY